MLKQNTSYSGTQAVTRAIQLLKLFDDDNPELDLITLTDLSGLNKSTTFRILSALESEGLIQKSNSGYRLGAEAIVLGGRAMRSNNLRFVSREPLEHLSQKTGETVTLEVLHLAEDKTFSSLVIDEVVGKHLVGISQYIGSRLPVHATSTGKVLLAYQSQTTLEALWTQEQKRFTKQTLDATKLAKQLKKIRRQGYATAKGELEQGLMTAAAPIFGSNAEVQAALSIVAPSIRIDEDKLDVLAQAAISTAKHISKSLGYSA